MKNKNRIFRAAALLLVLCFISTVMISGTFAKYTSEYSGSDTALVAKWSLDVEGGQEGSSLSAFATDGDESSVATLDLFSHAYNENIIEDAGAQKIIAPGVGGSFVLSVKNNSDVAAGVTFAFDTDGSSAAVPMEYRVGDGSWVVLADLPEELAKDIEENEDGYAFELGVAEGDDSKNVKVYWRWPFERTNGDAEDTGLGIDSADGLGDGTDGRTEYILTVTATATQLEPGSTTTTP